MHRSEGKKGKILFINAPECTTLRHYEIIIKKRLDKVFI
jgi:hypothetical protein